MNNYHSASWFLSAAKTRESLLKLRGEKLQLNGDIFTILYSESEYSFLSYDVFSWRVTSSIPGPESRIHYESF